MSTLKSVLRYRGPSFSRALASWRCHSFQTPVRTQARMHSGPKQGLQPHIYTDGRWLDRDAERREARGMEFDFDALLKLAIQSSPGACEVLSCEKKEGGYNRVFMIRLDNGTTVAARLPARVAGPPSLTTSSEVATLQYVKRMTTIPTPNVLGWSASVNNPAGTEYIIMEVMPGVLLRDVWKDMKAHQHVACIASIGRLCRQLCKLKFPAYGSLYFNTDAPSNVVKLDEDFCIGPACGPVHWMHDENPMEIEQRGFQGPWHNLEDHFLDQIRRARRRVQRRSDPGASRHDGLLDLLQQSFNLLRTTKDVCKAGQPTLFHPDFHTRNIFVDKDDPSKITGIIDWQSAAIEPAFVFAAETPDFATELPDESDETWTESDRIAQDRLRQDADFCSQTWAVMQQPCDNLGPASLLSTSLLRVLAAPSFGWTEKDLALETLLDELAAEWSTLGLPASSPHQPSKDDDVLRCLDEYRARRQMQDHLMPLLQCGSDGWVSQDRWEEVLARYRLEYTRFVGSVIKSDGGATADEKEAAIQMANRLWPFDQR